MPNDDGSTEREKRAGRGAYISVKEVLFAIRAVAPSVTTVEREVPTAQSTRIESESMVNFPQPEPPPPPKTNGPWVPLFCIGLGIVALWLVAQVSPQKSLLVGRPETALSQLQLLEPLKRHAFVVAVSVGLAVVTWMLFRRPRSR